MMTQHQAQQPNQTRQILEDDKTMNVGVSIASKWEEKYGLDIQQSISLMKFEGLSLEELVKLQGSLQAALSKEVAKFQ